MENTNEFKTGGGQFPTWEVFIQNKPGNPHKHAGCIHATDKEMALQNARDTYTRRGEGHTIWVVRTEDIISSKPEDEGMFFDPSDDKIYRQPTFYEIPEGVKNL